MYSPLALVGLAHSVVLYVIYVDRPGLDPDGLDHLMRVVAHWVIPLFELVAVACLVVISVRHTRRGAIAPTASA